MAKKYIFGNKYAVNPRHVNLVLGNQSLQKSKIIGFFHVVIIFDPKMLCASYISNRQVRIGPKSFTLTRKFARTIQNSLRV